MPSGSNWNRRCRPKNLMGTGWIKRWARRRFRVKPDRLAADTAYRSGIIGSVLNPQCIRPVTPTNSKKSDPVFGLTAYRERNWVERLIKNLKKLRQIAT